MPNQEKAWSLLSRHGQVIVLLAKNPNLRIVDIAKLMDISERSVRILLSSLHKSKILKVRKAGRNNTYRVNISYKLRNDLERPIPLKTIVDMAGMPQLPEDSSVYAPLH